MKTFFIKSCLILSGLLVSDIYVTSQSKFEISCGIGFPEAINLKVKYGKDVQIGLSQGYFPTGEPGFWGSTSLEINKNLAGKSKYTSQKVWYILGGINGFYTNGGDFGLLPYLRFGRKFNFSQRIGFNLDFGPMLLDKNDQDWFGTPVIPSGNIGLFMRL